MENLPATDREEAVAVGEIGGRESGRGSMVLDVQRRQVDGGGKLWSRAQYQKRQE